MPAARPDLAAAIVKCIDFQSPAGAIDTRFQAVANFAILCYLGCAGDPHLTGAARLTVSIRRAETRVADQMNELMMSKGLGRFAVRRRGRPSWSGAALLLAVLALAVVVMTFVLIRPVLAGDVLVIGDGIGADVGRIAGRETLAKPGGSIAYRSVYPQLDKVPAKSTVVLALGTRDAAGSRSLRHIGKLIDSIVESAAAKGLKMYWLGPACLPNSSDARATAIDQLLAQRLHGKSVTYVSLRRVLDCSRTSHALVGQHLGDDDLQKIWNSVAKTAGIADSEPAVAVTKAAPPAAATPLAVAPAEPAVQPKISPSGATPAPVIVEVRPLGVNPVRVPTPPNPYARPPSPTAPHLLSQKPLPKAEPEPAATVAVPEPDPEPTVTPTKKVEATSTKPHRSSKQRRSTRRATTDPTHQKPAVTKPAVSKPAVSKPAPAPGKTPKSCLFGMISC